MLDLLTSKDIGNIIERYIQAQIDARAPRIDPGWMTQRICNDYADIDGADAPFWRCAGREYIRNEIRKRLNRFKAKPVIQADPQLVLPGYNRLQQWYLLDQHDGESIALRIDLMTNAQLLQKAQELEAMGQGCFDHARELRVYLEQRRAA